MLVLAKNDAKQRLRNYNIEVNDLSQELSSVLSDVHFETRERITNKSKEKEYVKKRNHLTEKYQNLTKGNKIQEMTGDKSLLKPAVLNLTNQEIPQHHLELLNLGPKFVPSNKKLPFMDITNATEICPLSLEKESQIEYAELLRQKISNVTSKNMNFKIRSNLTFEHRTALKELSQSTENKVYSYDKGTGFVILNNKDAIRKIEEQIGESVVSNTDPTTALTNQIQKHLATLRKQQKFETRTYFQLYPSDPIPPRLYRVIKAHKPEKCHPMRAIVSTIGSALYGISQYLVELIQPTLNKSKYKTENSSSFVNEAKNWLVKRDEVQVSYAIAKLDVLIDQLNNDKDDLIKRTKLCLKDIYELAELCLSKCFFLWNNEIRILKNSGPIRLSFKVLLSESYVQNLKQKAIAETLTLNLAPKTYRRYVYDTHARSNLRNSLGISKYFK